MSNNAKVTLLKVITALVVIGTIALIVIVRAAIAPAVAVVQAERRPSVVVPPPPVAPVARPMLDPVVRNEVPPAPPPEREPELPAAVPSVPAPDVEARVQQQIERAVEADPRAALTMLNEADRQFPEGKLVAERQLLRLQAMVNLDQVAEARVHATQYLERNPHSPITRQIYRLLGIHARPELPSR